MGMEEPLIALNDPIFAKVIISSFVGTTLAFFFFLGLYTMDSEENAGRSIGFMPLLTLIVFPCLVLALCLYVVFI